MENDLITFGIINENISVVCLASWKTHNITSRVIICFTDTLRSTCALEQFDQSTLCSRVTCTLNIEDKVIRYICTIPTRFYKGTQLS